MPTESLLIIINMFCCFLEITVFSQCFYLCCHSKLSIITCLGNVQNIYWQVVHTFQLVVVNRLTVANYCFTATSDPPSAIHHNNSRSTLHQGSWGRPDSQYTASGPWSVGFNAFSTAFLLYNRLDIVSTVFQQST